MAIVSESHLVIHTWPEYGYAAVDIFTCGAPRDPQDAVDVLRRLFTPERIGVMEINRGQLDLPEYEVDVAAPQPCVRTQRRSRAARPRTRPSGDAWTTGSPSRPTPGVEQRYRVLARLHAADDALANPRGARSRGARAGARFWPARCRPA